MVKTTIAKSYRLRGEAFLIKKKYRFRTKITIEKHLTPPQRKETTKRSLSFFKKPAKQDYF